MKAPLKLRGNVIDVMGKRYGLLTALRLDHVSVEQGAYWRFACACGNQTVKRLKDVRYGNTASCGCAKGGNRQRGARTTDMPRPWDSAEHSRHPNLREIAA